MPLPIVSEKYEIRGLKLAGYYAVDVSWGDGHGSIFPLRDLRAHCPCEACREAGVAACIERANAEPRAHTPIEIAREPTGLRIVWEDDHTTVFHVRELRDACRCALCAGEVGPVEAFLRQR
jgi:DUF971 family protein